MAQTERLITIQRMLNARKYTTKQEFLNKLEISVATFKRDIEKLRDTYNYSIVYDRTEEAYTLGAPLAGPQQNFPGLWFSQGELTALVLMQHLLSQLDQSDIISPRLAPFSDFLDKVLNDDKSSSHQLRQRIKVIGMSSRKSSIINFEEVGLGLLKRKQLEIEYYVKARDENTTRIISPQQMIYYRENWYLDAFCHLRNGLRSFALDGIVSAKLTDMNAQEVSSQELTEHFTESYGIFSGKASQRAKLRVTPERSRYIKKEIWHPDQVSSVDTNGFLIIEFDFNQDPELIMDILKHGSHVEVLAPLSLKEKVVEEMKKSLLLYTVPTVK
jgi:predicted DNA-binding transcriptional regulator YafY